jgi:hypothetical protein
MKRTIKTIRIDECLSCPCCNVDGPDGDIYRCNASNKKTIYIIHGIPRWCPLNHHPMLIIIDGDDPISV